MSNLPRLVAHESYPGHHTEHCRKEAGLVERGGQAEQTIFLVNTPQCLMAEGLADLALHAAIGPDWGRWATEIYADLGLRFDGERAQAVSEASATLGRRPAGRGADAARRASRRRRRRRTSCSAGCWSTTTARARRLRFLSSPLWRAYTSTYVEGYRLLRGWLEARPDGGDARAALRSAARRTAHPVEPAGLAERTVSATLRAAVPSGD